MHHARLLLPALALALAGCDSGFGPDEDRCAGVADIGRLNLIIEPEDDFFDFEMMFLGDTTRLSASVRPITGASTDFWGGGGCAYHYGDAVAATIEWTSADPSIATVDQQGVVVARAKGLTRVVARDRSRGLQASRTVEVSIRGQPF